MADNGKQLCYLLVIIIAIGFIVWGFMDILKRKQSNESSEDQISRQIRGFAFIMLAQVVLVLGSAICFGMQGGITELGKKVRNISTRR
jgi:TRAP-type C4-dicarboxylate transport system permease small subunit